MRRPDSVLRIGVTDVRGVMQALGCPHGGGIFSREEIFECERLPRPALQYAMRLAAKEAVHRMLAPNPAAAVDWREIEVRQGRGLGPRLLLRQGARRRWQQLGLGACRISVCCSDEVAMAVVVSFARVSHRPACRRPAADR